MSFNEQFPSLKGLRWENDHKDGPYQEKNNLNSVEGFDFSWITQEDLEKHCLDKQKVSDEIINGNHEILIESKYLMGTRKDLLIQFEKQLKEKILMELGL